MFKRVAGFLMEYLRINAIRRMLRMVHVRRGEVVGLAILAGIFAIFEGAGLTLLLPILQYAESGQTAITDSNGAVWKAIGIVMKFLHLPVTLPVLLVLAFTPILMRQVVFYYNTWYSAVVAERIGVRMRMRVVETAFGADPEFFERHPVGHFAGVALTQTTAAGTAVMSLIKQVSVALLMAVYLALMIAISMPLTAATAVFGIVIAVVIKVNTDRIRAFGMGVAEYMQNMHMRVIERFGLARLVKLRGQENAEIGTMAEYSEELRSIRVKQARVGARIEVTADPLLMLSVFIMLYVGIVALKMTLPQLGLMIFVVSRLNAKVKEFNLGQQAISANMAGILLVEQTIKEARAANTILDGPQTFQGLNESLRLENVSFEYPAVENDCADADEPVAVLHGVSLEIPAGSFTAIVGRSGAGKSTLVELLPRLREATSGSITYDGTGIREFTVSSLRRGIGYLTQDPMLMNDTVFANLTYGLGFVPTDEQVRQALDQAYASFVYGLPAGLETRLGDRGVRFSGGEQQRLALARVLLADTSMLILDEPTSALDSESEVFIQKALANLHGRKTVIVIAHRLATVIQADQLLVIDGGHIVERGTHQELVDADGAYRKLFESQLLA